MHDTTQPPLYVSPILEALEPDARPQPSPACETCPASLWFKAADSLKCYCHRMHVMTWEPGIESPIMMCDGRELALVEIMEAQLAALGK